MSEGINSLVRDFLIRYGGRKDVRVNLMANFDTEFWKGSDVLHHEAKKQSLLECRDNEDNGRVKKWIDEYLDILEKRIEYHGIREERAVS